VFGEVSAPKFPSKYVPEFLKKKPNSIRRLKNFNGTGTRTHECGLVETGFLSEGPI
jgi:hypothetical protein